MKTKAVLLILFFLLTHGAYGQSFKLKGTVVDSSRVPLKGVFVAILESKKGHKFTNHKGIFTLKSHVGDTLILVTPEEQLFKAEITTQNNLTYVLVESGKTISIDRPLLTLVDEAEKFRYSDILDRFQRINVTIHYNTVFDKLKAEYPDLEINEGSGAIYIRGVNSLDNQPAMIIVDGVKNMDIRNINPQDIESITVVKDGTAGIYGGRASGGVIKITTIRAR
jgi:TonB-dependent SusC/RagA subfamily outer membrane receptor